MKIIKLPTDVHQGYIFQAQELVDDALGANTFLKQVWQSNVHAWIALINQEARDYDPPGCQYPYELAAYCSVKIDGDVGYLKTCVVDPHFTRRGIATKLTEHRIVFLKEQGLKTIRCNAWFVDGYCPAQKHLMRNGLKPIKDVRRLYEREHNEKFQCSKCGPYCKCVARIFEMKIKESA
jgi:ribosomal protein S18 acetylase RimI-like enzyme